ncbi:Flavin-dependent oxidoreductase, luciferase family (includes alkanesulfonate monooxygenase SsuD and methylene tetrahydromethanopterin reductase) [Quadrisphaera granulorum]|uniref:Alkanesulfonate monooxygenase SsuD/methylene tetrahydromethanopterin reductase-like flavin-dependent oxidoreductase (Luciferase family) n=1 Tax=Quadrisphaera granulorum TaxID=317664 RepID=A0A316A5J4_9ACTN|nr:LLM class flavin-dependent oxidoreductase [Quadrisphaera granulorum]PWJ52752.1 alkanesulfonate monooxygenase SsuD/methylene tetrahydromethanopterin reductase-like flavin-dependent oxidoreductase (luciferase family) [Quadrisphaera granulorum]SZE97357.1 Flavin-dependent oxidoreductase, luciferase family (includes alkanesulfonate monooxygenase SsuD and methylene tetrahydromethanopterin reductase) [Quadrisphaera granulorum]
MRFGVGLYCLQSTASTPRHPSVPYRELLEDAPSLEAWGYDGLWLSEHHFFYDGYCPALLPVAAAALAVTTRLRVGTGMMLLPLQEPARVARLAADVAARSGGRLDVGVGLGYRDVEFDGKGIRRQDRVARHRDGLVELERWAVPAGATVWNGSATSKGVARAAARGQGVLLSGANPLSLVTDLAAAHRQGWEDAGRPVPPSGARPRVSALRNVWLTDSPSERLAVLDWQRASYVLYAGLGWSVAEQGSTEAMDFRTNLDKAVAQAVDTSIVGPAEVVLDGLREVHESGVDDVVLRVIVEGAPRDAVHRMLQRFAAEVMPELAPLEHSPSSSPLMPSAAEVTP